MKYCKLTFWFLFFFILSFNLLTAQMDTLRQQILTCYPTTEVNVIRKYTGLCTATAITGISQAGATVTANDSCIVYSFLSGFLKPDTVNYTIDCNGLILNGILFITVVECPDNIDTADCVGVHIPKFITFQQVASSASVNNGQVHTCTSPLVGDIDGDGLVEIIVTSTSTDWYSSGNGIYIYNVDHDFKLSLHQTLSVGTILLSGQISIADVDKDGKAELFVVGSNMLRCYKLNASGLYATTPVWTASLTADYNNVQPMIADFDGDGIPEILVGNRIFNAVTGALVASGTYTDFGLGGHGSGTIATFISMFSVADFDNDGLPEIAIANNVYKVNIPAGAITLWKQCEIPDATWSSVIGSGLTSVADIDLDGYLDVVVMRRIIGENTAYLYVWNPMTEKLLHTNIVSVPNAAAALGRGPSLPFIGDLNNDGFPEIAFHCIIATSQGQIRTYKYDKTLQTLNPFWSVTTADFSGATNMTLFDFNQDGSFELVYRDMSYLRILDGKTGSNVIPPIACGSGTVNEYPVVADINGDGSVEIIVTGGDYDSRAGNLLIFGSNPLGEWAPARKVWNQFMYNVVNINEDLTVPQYQMNPATLLLNGTRPYNGFLKQQTLLNKYGDPMWPMPNIIWSAEPSIMVAGDSIVFTGCIKNIGDAALQTPIYISFYRNDTIKANFADNFILTDSIEKILLKDSVVCFTVTLNHLGLYTPMDTVWISINDRNGAYPYQQQCMLDGRRGFSRFVKKLPPLYQQAVTCWTNATFDMITLNDTLVPCLRTADTVFVYPPSAAGATITIDGDKNIVYHLKNDFIGLDTLDYSIKCTDTIYAGKLLITVIKCLDNIDDIECYGEPEDFEWAITKNYQSPAADHHNYAIPLVGDIDGDGIPEVITLNVNTRYLNILWGHDKTVTTIQMAEAATQIVTSGGSICPYAMFKTKIGGIDKFIIVVKGGPTGTRLDAYDLNGPANQSTSPLWTNTTSGGNFTESISIADFDGDGIPEVYAADRIYNAHTGQLLLAGSGNKGMCGNGYFTVAADINNDGKLELIAGNQVYAVNIPNKVGTAGNSLTLLAQMTDNIFFANGAAVKDGYTVVADINNDGSLDIIYLSSNSTSGSGGRMLVAWDFATESLICKSAEINTGKGTGVPFVGNIDSDPTLEVVFMVNDKLLGFKPDFSTKQFNLDYSTTVVDESGSTGMTIFDFNNDGINEIVYRDETQLRIMRATPGSPGTFTNIHTYSCTSTTSFEYPVVADVNNDGAAEIIVIGNTSGYVGNGYLWIFGSGNQYPWAPARKVWNQYAYNVVNVNKDLSIPQYQMNPAHFFPNGKQPYNNFLQQQTLLDTNGDTFWLLPNIVWDTNPKMTIAGDSATITGCIKNIGEVTLLAPIYITFYKNDTIPANILIFDSLVTPIYAGSTFCFSFIINDIDDYLVPMDTLWLSINDRNGTYPYQQQCMVDGRRSLPRACPSTITDNEGNTYNVTALVGLCWTTNLKNRTYADGADIPFAKPYYSSEYSDSTTNASIFGLLYSWYSAVRVPELSIALPTAPVQGICPNGWRLPTKEELNRLDAYSADELKSTVHWLNPGTDDYEFDARGAGKYTNDINRFIDLYGFTGYWTSNVDANSNQNAYYYYFTYYCNIISELVVNKGYGLSVRCVIER